MVTAMGLTVGAIGSTRRLVLTATNAAGSVSRTFTMTTRPFAMNKDRYLAFFDYTDPATMTLGEGGRIMKVVDKLHGRARVAPDDNESTPVFDRASKRMTLRSDRRQHLRMAEGATNDDWRSLLATERHRLTHIVFFETDDFEAPQPLFSYLDGSSVVLAVRINSDRGVEMRRPAGLFSQLRPQPLFSAATTPSGLVPGVPAYIGAVSNGVKLWGLTDNRVTQRTRNDEGNVATDVTGCDLGREGRAYFNGRILGEIVASDDLCASEVRGLYDTMQDAWGLPQRTEPEAFDWEQVEDSAFYDTGDEGIGINPQIETDFTRPLGWIPQIGDRTNRMGVEASNSTEKAFHLDPRYPGNAAAETTELTSDGKRHMRFRPIDGAGLKPAVKDYIASLKTEYGFVGSALSTRRFVAPGPSHALELMLRNPPAIAGNFACFGWTLAESGGHPPETDWNEQSGSANEISQGLHMAPRWPLMGRRLATGGTGFGMARSHTDREQHSYQFLIDAATDTIKYYQDGYLFSVQKPQRGLRLSSVKAFKAGLIAGQGGGTGILADNGTPTGTLKVLVGGGGLSDANSRRGARFGLKIVGGRAVDLYWDAAKDDSGAMMAFVPGSYEASETVSPLRLLSASGSAVRARALPDMTPLQVGIDDPVVPEDFHTAMYLIVNNAAGGFTGTPAVDQTSDGFLSRVTFHHVRRAAVIASADVATRAREHCAGLFGALAARGTIPSDNDRGLIYDFISMAMATDMMWGRPMDGADPVMDYARHRTLWDSIGMLGIFFGPYDGLVDWKDPANSFIMKKRVNRRPDLGFSFTGQRGGGQIIDTMKPMAALHPFGPWANGMTTLLTAAVANPRHPKRPLLGAGRTVALYLAGGGSQSKRRLDDGATRGEIAVPDCFAYRLGVDLQIASQSASMPMDVGIYTAVRREQRLNVWKNGDRTVPFYAGLIPTRDYQTGHSPSVVPATSLKIGSFDAVTQGAAASLGGFCLHRWWNDEEHARFVALLAPLARKYAVPLGLDRG
ncbi:hypothetical protein Sa4125_09010 [Aureimonas sp. SA4125]|nr:hypothetical protein Sa4125_09010 [Aureimonas sp. SA4125]